MNDSGAPPPRRRHLGPHRPAAGDAHDLDHLVLLGFGMFFELYDLLFTAYVAPSLVKSGVLTAKTVGLFGATGVASFIAALFAGLFVGTILCGFLADFTGGGRSSPGRSSGTPPPTSWWRCRPTPSASTPGGSSAGVGLGLEMVTIGAYVSELAPKRLRGSAFAVNQAIGFACVPVISFLPTMLVPAAPLGIAGWRWVVLIGALAAPVVVFLRRRLPESPRWLAKHGRLAEADRALKGASRPRSRPNTESRCRRPARTNRSRRRAPFMDLWVPGVRGRVILMSVFNVFQTVGFYGFSNWVPSLLVKQGITVSTSLGYTTIIALAAPVGPLIGFFLGDRFERKWIIVARGLRDPLLRARVRPGAGGGAHHRHGGRADARQTTSCPTASTPISRSCFRPGSGRAPQASSIPGAGSRSSSAPSSSPSCSTVRRLRRLRLHRRRDGGRDGDDRDFRPQDDQSGAGEDRSLTRCRGGSAFPAASRIS